MSLNQQHPAPPLRRVNDLLANARAEHTRHIQNVSRAVRRAPQVVSYGPTLPFVTDVVRAPSPPPTVQSQTKKPAGPAPPRSWVSPITRHRTTANMLSSSTEAVSSRSQALSWIYARLSSPRQVDELPSLADYCLLSLITPDFWEEAVISLPPHLRSKLARLAALQRPLSYSELVICWGPDYSGTEGEAIVIGREAYPALKSLLQTLQDSLPEAEESWDMPSHLRDLNPPPPLHTIVLYGTPLPAIASLPRSLTHLALTFASFDAVRVARGLPKAIPMLEYLDVYDCEGIGSTWFESIDWRRWVFLKSVRLKTGVEEGSGWQARVRRAIELGREGRIEVYFE